MRPRSTAADHDAMHTHLALPLLATGAALMLGVGSSSAYEGPTQINCLDSVCAVLQPAASDSDGDGFTDADEKLFGSDPDDAGSRPPMVWVIDRIADGTLPGFWLEPTIDLVTLTPDGNAITASFDDVMATFGLKPLDALGSLGLTMAPAGVHLGTIGADLDWQIHVERTSGQPRPPDAPDSSLYGFTNTPPSEAKVEMDKGYAYVQSSFSFGEFTSTVHIHKSDGTLLGSGSATHRDPWQAQANATAEATKDATPDAAADIAAAIEADARAKAKAADEAAAKVTAEEKAAKDEAAKAQAAKAQAEADAKAKAEAEAKAKAEAEEKAKDGGMRDPDYGAAVDPRFLTPAQMAALIAAGDGSYFTHTGDTGVLALVTPGDYMDPTVLIIHIDPDADPATAGGALSDAPDLDDQAGPEYDPNLPQGPGPGTGSLPLGGTKS